LNLTQNEPSNRKNICVIVPTYNNHKTLKRVLDSVLLYTKDIIIVNDGSTDKTLIILENYPQITQIQYAKNRGKGMALRKGFEKAIHLGYDYAITIDSDGQHFASDIPLFISEIPNNTSVLLIGSRNMMQEGVPKKSSFGNKFSNFWFWFETGNRLEDTQSGFRLYPLKHIPVNYFTTKFEFEIEVIVRSAWKGIPVKNIPIQVLYDPEERVSHFRPFQDFTRISILNTVLVFISLFYIRPRDFFSNLKKKGIKKFFLENILESNDSNARKSLSIALGVFIGISPFWGLQTIIVLFLAVLFKLNKAISFAFSNISFPPFIPFIIFGSLKIGGYFIRSTKPLIFDSLMTFSDVQVNIGQYLVGSFILATIMSILFGLSGYIVLTIFSTFRNKK
jgi:glycosyltransferase involved in cell wall biosynthesis